MILNHGSENPVWLSPSPLQRDDKPVSSVIAFFLFSFPQHPPSSTPALRVLPSCPGMLRSPGTLPTLAEKGTPWLRRGTAPGAERASSSSATVGAPKNGGRHRICIEEQN